MEAKKNKKIIGWKFAYVRTWYLGKLMTGMQRKLFRLKTCPQEVLQVQEEKSGFWIIASSNFACLCENWPLKIP